MTTIDELTQDSVWYNALAIFEKYGIKLPSRKYFKGLIRKVCRKLGVTREDIGIVAAPWAIMYYKGEWTAVSFDAVDSLAEKGTDIVFIEKLDLVRVHGKYADKFGIALVNSHGHMVEYAEDLAAKAQASGAHVGIAVDYDIPGVLIASALRGVVWLGVNEETLEYFGISKQDTQRVVPYNPKKKRITDENFRDLVKSDYRFHRKVDVEFLRKNKVELDAVLAEVGSERLFEYWKELLEKEYPRRDYTRVIESRPQLEDHYPKAIRNFTKYIYKHAESITEKESEKIEEELKDVEGFIDVPEKEKAIDKRLGDIIEGDQHLKDIAAALVNLAREKGYDLNQFDSAEKMVKKASKMTDPPIFAPAKRH
jgi:hypothetical protein